MVFVGWAPPTLPSKHGGRCPPYESKTSRTPMEAHVNRATWTALALAAVGAGAFAADDPPREVKILARGAWTHLPTHTSAGIGTDREHHLWTIRSEQELTKLAGNSALLTVPKAFKAEAIDFKKQ